MDLPIRTKVDTQIADVKSQLSTQTLKDIYGSNYSTESLGEVKQQLGEELGVNKELENFRNKRDMENLNLLEKRNTILKSGMSDQEKMLAFQQVGNITATNVKFLDEMINQRETNLLKLAEYTYGQKQQQNEENKMILGYLADQEKAKQEQQKWGVEMGFKQANLSLDLQKQQHNQNMDLYNLDLKERELNNKSTNSQGFNAFDTTQNDFNVTAGITKNRPDRNNNPGNVKIGDVGYGVDDQQHTIFGDPNQGFEAMKKDIIAKVSGKSKYSSKLTSQKLSPTSTLADLGSVYAEDTNWVNNVVSIANRNGYKVSKTTPLKDLDINQITLAIAQAEGFTGKITPKASTKEQEVNSSVQPSASLRETVGGANPYAGAMGISIGKAKSNNDGASKYLKNINK